MQYIFILLILLGLSCENLEKKEVENQPSLSELELIVRQDQDNRAVFEYDDYEKILLTIKDKQCKVLPLYQMKDYYDSTIIIVGIKHDVDRHPFKALEIAEIEKKYGFSSTYYFLPTAMYYGKHEKDKIFIRYSCLDDIYLKIFLKGHEIGIHNDLLTVMIEWGLEPFKFNKFTIDEFNRIGIPIYGTSSHGANICYAVKHYNFEIFSDFATTKEIEYGQKKYLIGQKTLKEFGFAYEAYHIDYNIYISDVGGKWYFSNDKKHFVDMFFEKNNLSNNSFDDVLNKIKNAKAGDRIVILTHPVWWGKK